ncbi:MAG: sigma-54-dependent transcriptional regulator [Opitutales bacterium]
MSKIHILVVDDEEGILEVCEDALSRIPGVSISTEIDSSKAAERIQNDPLDILITDICMPKVSGVDLLRILRERDPNSVALTLTAYPDVDTAVEVMKQGAADYITKPFHPDHLVETVVRLIERRQLRDENQLLRRQVERPYAFGEMLGASAPMQKVFETIRHVSEMNVDVLITGETGTGKELVARAIHKRSARAKKVFVPVDCGAIPEELMESEFFGYEKGAFTGAAQRTIGLLEYANGGTLFLDEIGQLPLRLQAKLLRVLQERQVRRVGGKGEMDVDIRVIAATGLNLNEEVNQGRFRLDLYHRIHVAAIHLPPLREREGDIPYLAEHMLAQLSREIGRVDVSLSPEALEVMNAYSWPGNVRELQNVLRHTLAMGRDAVIKPEALPDEIVAKAGDTGSLEGGFFAMRERRVASFEKDYLSSLLRQCDGDVSKAAREAKVPRGTFYRLLSKHELDPATFRN